MAKHKRSTIFYTNKFQRAFFYPVVVAFILGCIVSWLNLMYFIVGKFIPSIDWADFHQMIPGFLLIATALMIFVIFWTFRISSRCLGPYTRIIQELDEVLDGRKNGPLAIRSGDKVFDDLLKRINILIERKRQKI